MVTKDIQYISRKKTVSDSLITDNIFPLVTKSLSSSINSYKNCVGRFIHKNHDQLYDYAPIDRIYFRQQDIDDFFKSMKINEKDITDVVKRLYYYNDNELQACKDEFSLTQLMVFKYFMIKKDQKMAELSCLYLAFSGKFYASAHYKWFSKFVPKREVMDYVINNMLSNKYDIVSQKSLWGAVRSLTGTWMQSYSDTILDKKATDEDYVYIIHQLYERIYAFLRNIAIPYYEAVEKKLYLNYESDNYNDTDGKYRIADNTSTILMSITETTIRNMTSTTVNISRCVAVSDKGVDPYDIKSIFENILADGNNINDLRDVINITLVDFCRNYPNVKPKDVPISLEYISHTIKAKPNTKDKDLLHLKDVINKWLNTSSRYRSIKTPATLNNYNRAILMYIALTVNAANK